MKAPTDKPVLPLHTHTALSLMDGVSMVEDYIKYCAENGMEACSCTDHGYVLGLYDLLTKCQKHKVKGIPGVEAYLDPGKDYVVAPGRKEFKYFHLTLWAMNQEGYKNLLLLSNASWGFGRVVYNWGQPKPRITWQDLEDHNAGLICGSGCIEGPIVKPFLRGEKDMSALNAGMLMEIFGDRLFMEVMPHRVDRDWTTKGVVQVEGSNGVTYTFAETDQIETNLGWMSAKEAMDKKVGEIFSTNPDRPQEHSFSNREIQIEPEIELMAQPIIMSTREISSLE